MKPFQRVTLLLFLAIGVAHARPQGPIYFLVGEVSTIAPAYRKNDSYVLPLIAAQDIQHARKLILKNQLGLISYLDYPIVGAWTVAGRDGINRNFLDPRFPEWSWHVELIQFAQGSAEILDGWPTYTEYVYNLTHSFLGEIGYWDYTVVRELGPAPLFLSIIPETHRLQFYWSGLGSNYLYTLECKTSLASTNWSALAGAGWPLKTNHWTMPRTTAVPGFYRVKAEVIQTNRGSLGSGS